MSICPFCSEQLNFAERAVRFCDDETGEEVVLQVEAAWCGDCREYQRIGEGEG